MAVVHASFVGRINPDSAFCRTILVRFDDETGAKKVMKVAYNFDFSVSSVKVRYNRTTLLKSAQFRMYRTLDFVSEFYPEFGFLVKYGKPYFGSFPLSVYDFVEPFVFCGCFIIPVEEIVRYSSDPAKYVCTLNSRFSKSVFCSESVPSILQY